MIVGTYRKLQEAEREGVHFRQGVRPLHDLEAFLYQFVFNFVGLLIFNPRQKSLYSANFDVAAGEVQDNELDGVRVKAGHQQRSGTRLMSILSLGGR